MNRRALTPEDWIREAMALLVDSSVDGVRVDVLARRMQVTRGSFYHHFDDRDDLLQRMLAHWKHRQTEHVIERYERSDLPALQRIHDLAELPFHGETARVGGAIELAIRGWARRDDVAHSVVEQVDELRLKFIRHCFARLGFGERDGALRAFVLYGYMQSEAIFRLPGSDAQRRQRREFVTGLLTRDPA